MKKKLRAPEHLSDEMKRFWTCVNRDYELEPDALLILQAACEQWDRCQQARVQIGQEGLTVDGRRNPCLDVEKVSYGLFLRAMRQLGLDVVAPGQPVGRKAAH
jgi:phage terminase small subunit